MVLILSNLKRFLVTDKEYEKALEDREKSLREEQMKAFELSKEEIEQLKKEGRI